MTQRRDAAELRSVQAALLPETYLPRRDIWPKMILDDRRRSRSVPSHETFFDAGKLIVVQATIVGPRGTMTARMLLDTGATMTTVSPEFLDLVGYNPRDGARRTRVHSAVGEEHVGQVPRHRSRICCIALWTIGRRSAASSARVAVAQGGTFAGVTRRRRGNHVRLCENHSLKAGATLAPAYTEATQLGLVLTAMYCELAAAQLERDHCEAANDSEQAKKRGLPRLAAHAANSK